MKIWRFLFSSLASNEQHKRLSRIRGELDGFRALKLHVYLCLWLVPSLLMCSSMLNIQKNRCQQTLKHSSTHAYWSYTFIESSHTTRNENTQHTQTSSNTLHTPCTCTCIFGETRRNESPHAWMRHASYDHPCLRTIFCGPGNIKEARATSFEL